jgi:transcriptional regulator with XRE-family HTH domain
MVAVMDAFRARREHLGLTQKDIATAISMAERSITGYEMCERTPTLQKLAMMLRAVGMRITVGMVE